MRVIIIATCFFLCQSGFSQGSFSQGIIPNKYTIYSKVLSDFFGYIEEEYENIRVTFLKRRTNYHGVKGNYEDERLNKLALKLNDSEKNKRLRVGRVDTPFKLKGIGKLRLTLMFVRGVGEGWKKFKRKNPRAYGIIEVSDIVFSEEGDYCLLVVGYRRGGRHGTGTLLLVNLEGEPEIIKEKTIWKS